MKPQRIIAIALLVLACLVCRQVMADTGLVSRCDGVTVATQAAACTGSRSFIHPTAGDAVDYVLSYPSVPADSTTIAWNDPNLQFRLWSAIPPGYGVQVCTANLAADQLTIPVGGIDQCAPGASKTLKLFAPATQVQLATGTTTPITGAVVVGWNPPTQNTDGTAVAGLVGFRIYYGTAATSLTQSVTITNPGLVSYTVSNLTPGTWYFAITAFNAALESVQSAVVSAPVLAPKKPGSPTNPTAAPK